VSYLSHAARLARFQSGTAIKGSEGGYRGEVEKGESVAREVRPLFVILTIGPIAHFAEREYGDWDDGVFAIIRGADGTDNDVVGIRD
jgi:hypothetical protein